MSPAAIAPTAIPSMLRKLLLENPCSFEETTVTGQESEQSC